MSDARDDDENTLSHGTVVRAQNGDVIRYDPTGLVLRLSDRVIKDIALRLDGPNAPRTDAPIDPDALRDIDAWAVSRIGDWLHFTARLPGAQGVRGFRRAVDGGPILADGPGPVLGLFAIGGPRAALASPGAPAFPYHVMGAADDIGAVGMAGVETAPQTDGLEPLRECTHEVTVADTLLAWQMENHRPLPLWVARAETDTSDSATALANGQAAQNLLTAAKNLKAAAARLGKPAKIKAICLDFAWEHVNGDATAFRNGLLDLMTRLSDGLWAMGYDQPPFVTRFEAGLALPNADAVIVGQWELSWNHGDHPLICSAPATMFDRDRFDRPTEAARTEMAEMTAAALAFGHGWRCPTPMLAERAGGTGDQIRLTFQALGPLAIDPNLPHGVTVLHQGKAISVTDVCLDPTDPNAILATCKPLPPAGEIALAFGCDGPTGVHDDWCLESATGRLLRRYAIPARLPVHGGPRA